MVKTRVNFSPHIVEYCIGKWGTDFHEPVKFPDNSELYFTVYDLLQKRPADHQTDVGNLEIVLPSRRYDDELGFRKNPEVYNYLSERSCRIISKKIERYFWAELHDTLDYEKHTNGIDYIETIHYFMCKYRIESISEDALIKNYYRWRDQVRKKAKRAYRRKNC